MVYLALVLFISSSTYSHKIFQWFLLHNYYTECIIIHKYKNNMISITKDTTQIITESKGF
jgi:hypothetical protein